jgi:hypothetical protein
MNNEPLENVQGHLRGLLSRLPDVPVSSNFTLRVLQAAELEEMRASRWRLVNWNWRVFFPRAAATATIVGFAAVAFYQHEISVQRTMLAKSAVLVAQSGPVSMDALKNFDAIQRMGQTAHPDDELLALASDMK